MNSTPPYPYPLPAVERPECTDPVCPYQPVRHSHARARDANEAVRSAASDLLTAKQRGVDVEVARMRFEVAERRLTEDV